jgi:hypothetical protein
MDKNEIQSTKSFKFEAPLGDLQQGRILIVNGAPKVVIESDPAMAQLVRAEFERPIPEVTVEEGILQIRYPGYSLLNWLVYWRQPLADLTLNTSIPWRIEGHGGVSSFVGDLSGVQLSGIDLHGGVSHFRVKLPVPSGSVPIRLVGGVSDLFVDRPEGAPISIQVRGGIGSFSFDGQQFGSMGGQPRIESPGYQGAANRYEIQITGGAGRITTGFHL